jgi:hypothetical protein
VLEVGNVLFVVFELDLLMPRRVLCQAGKNLSILQGKEILLRRLGISKNHSIDVEYTEAHLETRLEEK